jgi:hypothetical protein
VLGPAAILPTAGAASLGHTGASRAALGPGKGTPVGAQTSSDKSVRPEATPPHGRLGRTGFQKQGAF